MILNLSQPIDTSITGPKILQGSPEMVQAFTEIKYQGNDSPTAQNGEAGFIKPNSQVFDVCNFFIAAVAVFPSTDYRYSNFIAMVMCYRFRKNMLCSSVI